MLPYPFLFGAFCCFLYLVAVCHHIIKHVFYRNGIVYIRLIFYSYQYDIWFAGIFDAGIFKDIPQLLHRYGLFVKSQCGQNLRGVLSLRFSGRMTSLPPYSILLHRSANLALSAKYSFAIESFALNPSPPVLLCEQENPVPMRVQWYSLWSIHVQSFFMFSICLHYDYHTVYGSSAFWLHYLASNCLLTALSVFRLHTAFQFSCC